MKLTCIDTEFTDKSSEILELAAFNIDGDLIFHEYFQPIRSKKWDSSIHGITPEMVRNKTAFKKKKKLIQSIFDSIQFIVGFAPENDIEVLRKEGIAGLNKKTLIDVRSLYWLCFGKDEGYTLFNGPRLDICLEKAGIELSEVERHTALGDAKATMLLFRRLLRDFNLKYYPETDLSFYKAWEKASLLIEKERKQHFRNSARGYISLIKNKNGTYNLRHSAHIPEDNNLAEITIAVEDRYKAQYELMKKFRNTSTSSEAHAYRLTSSHLLFFSNYTNIYSEKDATFYRKHIKRH